MQAALKAPDYDFTQDWFSAHAAHWLALVDRVQPRRILEVGCYEGRASTFFIEQIDLTGGTLTCVDTWTGSADLPPEAMVGVEHRFDHNTAVALSRCVRPVTFHKRKRASLRALADMVAREEHFDLIYIDGSHTAPDVLTDAVLAFELLRFGGAMVFDDYAWQFEPQGRQDPLNMPKPAIDAFVNLNLRRLTSAPFGNGHWQYLILRTA